VEITLCYPVLAFGTDYFAIGPSSENMEMVSTIAYNRLRVKSFNVGTVYLACMSTMWDRLAIASNQYSSPHPPPTGMGDNVNFQCSKVLQIIYLLSNWHFQ
jgi:hypothetical protein